MNVELRDATVEDRDQVELLLAEYLFEFDGRTGPYPRLDDYWIDPERIPLLIAADGRAVGVCLVRVRDGGWSIAEFFVEPSSRRAGVGRAAVETLAERAGGAGAEHLEAKIHPDKTKAFRFWADVGFEQVSATGVLTTRRRLGSTF